MKAEENRYMIPLGCTVSRATGEITTFRYAQGTEEEARALGKFFVQWANIDPKAGRDGSDIQKNEQEVQNLPRVSKDVPKKLMAGSTPAPLATGA